MSYNRGRVEEDIFRKEEIAEKTYEVGKLLEEKVKNEYGGNSEKLERLAGQYKVLSRLNRLGIGKGDLVYLDSTMHRFEEDSNSVKRLEEYLEEQGKTVKTLCRFLE